MSTQSAQNKHPMSFRCSECNRVSSYDIETNIGDKINGDFYRDPKNKLFLICADCRSWHEELMYDYHIQDVHNDFKIND